MPSPLNFGDTCTLNDCTVLCKWNKSEPGRKFNVSGMTLFRHHRFPPASLPLPFTPPPPLSMLCGASQRAGLNASCVALGSRGGRGGGNVYSHEQALRVWGRAGGKKAGESWWCRTKCGTKQVLTKGTGGWFCDADRST